LPLNDTPAGLIQKTASGGLHHKQGHKVLKHGTRPGNEQKRVVDRN